MVWEDGGGNPASYPICELRELTAIWTAWCFFRAHVQPASERQDHPFANVPATIANPRDSSLQLRGRRLTMMLMCSDANAHVDTIYSLDATEPRFRLRGQPAG